MSTIEVTSERATAAVGEVSIQSVTIPVKIAFSFGKMMEYLHHCATCVSGNKRNFENLVAWCCCYCCKRWNFDLSRWMLKAAVCSEIALVTLLILNFFMGYFGNCTGGAALYTAMIGFFLTLIYLALQIVILVYVYIPVCFLFAANFALYHSTNESLFQNFINEFFEITVTAAVVSAQHVRCRVQSEVEDITHEVLEMAGAAVGGRFKFMVYSTEWWLKFLCFPIIIGFFTIMAFIVYFGITMSVTDSGKCKGDYGTALGVAIAVFAFYVGLAYCLIRIPLIQQILLFISRIVGFIFSCLCVYPIKRCLLRNHDPNDEKSTNNPMNKA